VRREISTPREKVQMRTKEDEMDLYLQIRTPGTYLVCIDVQSEICGRIAVRDLKRGAGGDDGETCLMLCLCMHGRVKNWECPHLPQKEGKLLPKESSDIKGKLGWQWKLRNSSRGVDHVLGPLFPTTEPAMTVLTLLSIVQAKHLRIPKRRSSLQIRRLGFYFILHINSISLSFFESSSLQPPTPPF
jgi:hypothetical protein